MLAFLFDIGGGYLVAKYIRRLWLMLPAAVLVGMVSSISANMLMHLLASSMFTPGETVARMLAGVIWHPIFTIIAALWWRRGILKRAAPVQAPVVDA